VRTLQTMVAAAVAVTLLAGCGSGAAAPAASGNPSGSASNGASGDTLIVYTNSDGEGRGEWLTQKAAAAGFKIEIVGAGGADATNKLIAEKNNPIADVAYGLNNMYFEQVKAAGALEPFTPAWSGEVDATKGDKADDKAY
jgi:iron(III) transport system substrate-binding protein